MNTDLDVISTLPLATSTLADWEAITARRSTGTECVVAAEFCVVFSWTVPPPSDLLPLCVLRRLADDTDSFCCCL